MTEATSDASLILDRALKRLQKRERGASVRSLALQLELTHSYLSKIFRGVRPVPLKLLPRLSQVLQLDHHETLELQRHLVEAFETRGLKNATGLSATRMESTHRRVVDNYETFGPGDFWLLEEWYHLPLFNLASIEGFVNAPEWIASRLGITPAQAKNSFDRLVAAGYLRVREDGAVEQGLVKLRFPTQRSHSSIRDYHGAMIEKAAKRIKKRPTEEEFAKRLMSGLTFAADPAKVTEAKVILEEAMYRAAEVLASGECEEVFQMNVQLFTLTR